MRRSRSTGDLHARAFLIDEVPPYLYGNDEDDDEEHEEEHEEDSGSESSVENDEVAPLTYASRLPYNYVEHYGNVFLTDNHREVTVMVPHVARDTVTALRRVKGVEGVEQLFNVHLVSPNLGDPYRVVTETTAHSPVFPLDGTVREYVYELLRTLSRVHARGITHGNVCPSTIECEDGAVTLFDFSEASDLEPGVDELGVGLTIACWLHGVDHEDLEEVAPEHPRETDPLYRVYEWSRKHAPPEHDQAYKLMRALTRKNVKQRLSCTAALRHEWFATATKKM